jgi:hypothetical protein
MKWLAGTALTIALLLFGALCVRSMRVHPPHSDDGGIRIVAGVDRPIADPRTPLTGVTVPATAGLQSIAHTGDITSTASGTDAEAIAALFDGQTRDPTWAPGAEAEIRSHLPTGADIRCAEFMCRIVVPMPAEPAITSPDQQAYTAARDWSARLSYNRLTATVVVGQGKPMLAFYATKTTEFTRIVDES